MSFIQKKLNFISTLVLLAALVVFLTEIDKGFALKCYECGPHPTQKKCEKGSNGQLKTCIFHDDVCFKYVYTNRTEKPKPDSPNVGESKRRGCGPYDTNHTHTPGCQYISQRVDRCYCDTDRCNAHEDE